MADDEPIRAPLRLRALASWQAGKVATLGTRLTAAHMTYSARSDFAALAALEEFGPLSQADIGRRLGLDRNDVNAVLTRLDDEQRIDRHPDPADRRRNVVTLTAAGRRHLDALQHGADLVQAELLTALDAAEQEHLQVLLEKVLAGHRPEPA